MYTCSTFAHLTLLLPPPGTSRASTRPGDISRSSLLTIAPHLEPNPWEIIPFSPNLINMLKCMYLAYMNLQICLAWRPGRRLIQTSHLLGTSDFHFCHYLQMAIYCHLFMQCHREPQTGLKTIIQIETAFLLLGHTVFRAPCIDAYILNKSFNYLLNRPLYCVFW